MMIHNSTVKRILVLMVLLLPLAGCRPEKGKNTETLARRMAEMDLRKEEITRSKVEEYRRKIDRIESDTEKVIKGVQETGTLYELLGMKYLDLGMPLEAHESFSRAVDIYPGKETLLYYRGITAALVAKTRETEREGIEWMERAERSYWQALEANTRFSPAYYSLAVLMVYELGRAEEAIPLLESYIGIEPGDSRGRFLLAQVYDSLGMNDKARTQYGEVVRLGRDKELTAEARQRLADGEGY